MKLINLLPKIRQNELRYEAVYHSLISIFIFSLFSFALVFIIQFATKFYLEIKASSLSDQIAQLKNQVNKQENADVKKQVQAINDIITDFNKLSTTSPKWSRVIKAFAVLPPEEIEIKTFMIDVTKKTISINGLSPTRELVIQLYNNILKDETNFYNIDYPLENVAKPTEINFHFTFFIRDSLLQP